MAPSISASPIRRARTGSATTASPPRTGSTSSATGSCGAPSSAGRAITNGTSTTGRWISPPRTASRPSIAELIHAVPDWAMRKFAHARQVRADGRPLTSNMGVSAATGGFANNGGGAGALTLNCPEVKEAAGNFLKALATRYKGHPGLLGYDVWNECNYSPEVDYSTYTKAAFRDWLRAKYGDLETLARAWNRYSYAEWDDIEPPHRDGALSRMPRLAGLQARQLLRPDAVAHRHDPRHRSRLPDRRARRRRAPSPTWRRNGCDDWLAASKVELYGFTWIAARKGNQPWRNFYGGDMTRAAARGKPFWHAERQGGPLWMQPQVLGPRQGRRSRRRSGRRPRLDDDVVRRRRHRSSQSALAAAARRSAVRRLRLLRHGRLAHAALRHGERHGQMG